MMDESESKEFAPKVVGFEKPLAISEIDSGEKNVEKKEELYSLIFDVLVHT